MAPATALSLERLCLVVGPRGLLPFFLRAERVLVVSHSLEVTLRRPLLLCLKRASS